MQLVRRAGCGGRDLELVQKVAPTGITQPPWRFFLVAIAGWMHKQQDLMASLIEENRILREKLGGKRILLNANQKSRLAVAVAKGGRASIPFLSAYPIIRPDA